MPGSGGAPRILVVDDVARVRTLFNAILSRAGYVVVTAEDGTSATRLIQEGDFDLILCDIVMPGIDGISLLRNVREQDPELPVILLTGSANAQSAIAAVNLSATAYLQKPIASDKLLEEVHKALKLRQLAKARRRASAVVASVPPSSSVSDRDLVSRFERALSGLFLLYQPIVSYSRRTIFAYEALMRSSEPSLADPLSLLDAAEKLDRLHDLGRAVRAHAAGTFRELGDHGRLFVNLHAHDLLDDALYTDTSMMPHRLQVVFELTERANLDDIPDLRNRIDMLRDAGFRIAIDDIGAGYSGLNTFASLRPDFVKLDMALVRGIDTDPVRQRVAHMLIDLCVDLGVSVVGEGVETDHERDTLQHLGCDLMQGYLFARPGAPFPEPIFAA